MSGTEGSITPASIHGEAGLAANETLTGNLGQWVPTSLVVTLPEPGWYHLSWDIGTQICAIAANNTNIYTLLRVVDDATGAELTEPKAGVQHQWTVPAGTTMQACTNASPSITHVVEVTAAQASRTLRLQGQAIDASTGPNSTIQLVNVLGDSRVTWHKLLERL